jgi:hypothetical protein
MMSKLLQWLPAWVWAVLETMLLLAAGTAGFWLAWELRTAAVLSAQKDAAEVRALSAAAAQQEEAHQRAIEDQDSQNKEKNHDQADAALAQARADAAGARSAYQRLQHEYAGFLRQHAAGDGAGSAAGEPAAAGTVCVSADLLQRYFDADDAEVRGATEVARFADDAHVSGASAEREYDAVRAARGAPSPAP